MTRLLCFACIGVIGLMSTSALAETSLADCADGVDNDGDGDIDLNDAGCACADESLFEGELESFIPNPSFEDYSSCPTSYSQLDRCDDWQQATSATSDYFACGYWFSGFGTEPTPPDGTAFVSALSNSSSYTEYIGACTDETLEAGTEYTFELYVAGTDGSYYGGATSGEIQLFGISSCGSIPISTYDTLDGSYDLLDEVTVSVPGDGSWQVITFTFTPTSDYDAIIFGAGPDMTLASGRGYNLLAFDALTLNASTSFGTEVSVSGDCEEDGYIVSGPEPTDVSFQWYLDGEAISGATSSTYEVPESGDGDYTLRVDDGTDCSTSSNDVTVESCITDTDGDGIDDEAEDINGDGDYDNDDTDGDGTPDYLDTDDDGDGVLTETELLEGDGDGDGTDDYLDTDDDNDGVLTEDETDEGDTDGDGTDDYLDTDDDGDGLLTEDETGEGDTDGDGTDDYLDNDDDGDGILTSNETGRGDTDGDGTDNYLDDDDDGDGVLTETEFGEGDTDGDGTQDYLDTDDDNDGVLTEDETGEGDTDGDGTDDYLDTDDDGDGILTEDETAEGDSDGDGTDDYL
ncbi:MAG: hypothetical protein GY913_17840, partial [Proteobacteria bacterium]|nr:hypothetical protein [Pseudomonadota bacterium]